MAGEGARLLALSRKLCGQEPLNPLDEVTGQSVAHGPSWHWVCPARSCGCSFRAEAAIAVCQRLWVKPCPTPLPRRWHHGLAYVGAQRGSVPVAVPLPCPAQCGGVSPAFHVVTRFCVTGQRVRQMSFHRRRHCRGERAAREVVCR